MKYDGSVYPGKPEIHIEWDSLLIVLLLEGPFITENHIIMVAASARAPMVNIKLRLTNWTG